MMNLIFGGFLYGSSSTIPSALRDSGPLGRHMQGGPRDVRAPERDRELIANLSNALSEADGVFRNLVGERVALEMINDGNYAQKIEAIGKAIAECRVRMQFYKKKLEYLR